MTRAWLPPLLWAGAIVLGTSLPASSLPDLSGRDKIIHFAVYAVLAALVYLAAARRKLSIKALTLTVIAVAAFGAVDEWHQRFIPGRTTDVADWYADSLGGMVGVVIAVFLKPIWLKRSQA